MKQWMQKKKSLLALALVLLAGFAYWNWPGPAPDLPEATEIQSVDMEATETIWLRIGGFYPTQFHTFSLEEPGQIETFLTYVSEARKTRHASTDDQPSVRPYIRVDIHKVDGSQETAYIYQKRGKTYLEVPYRGVYTLKEPLEAWLMKEIHRHTAEFHKSLLESTPSAED